MKTKEWIEGLQLLSHPEGGYYKEVYRSDEEVSAANLPDRFSANRSFSTAIYFLLDGLDFSAFHRIKSDEIWHFYDGSCLRIYVIDDNGKLHKHLVGKNIIDGELPMVVIPKNTWFAAEVLDKESHTLIGCTVSPGFHFDDFEMGNKDQLMLKYPEHAVLIGRLCR